MKNVFPERFTKLLNSTDMSYDEIAKKLGIKSKGTISKYAHGDIKNIELSMVIKIAKVFEVSPIWLLGFTKNKHYEIKE